MTLQYGLRDGVMPGYASRGSWTPREIHWRPDAPRVYASGAIMDGTNSIDGGNTGYETELRPGWLLAMVTATKKLVPVKRSQANGQGVAATALIVDNAAAFKVGDTIIIKGRTGIVKMVHSASAASTGLALYLHLDELSESPFGHLESVTANNADSTFTTLDGAVVKVEDDDAAATGGVAIYFDEDATNPDERFLAAVPTGKDAFILASDGRAIRIKYNATPSTPGVLAYFDDDGAANTRMLFVSPTTANGIVVTDDVVGSVVDSTNKITRSSTNTISAIDYTTNTLTITAASWADNDEVYCDSLAGSETALFVLDSFIALAQTGTREDILVGVGTPSLNVVLIQGWLIASMLLGDAAACLAVDSDTKVFRKITLDTDYGFVG